MLQKHASAAASAVKVSYQDVRKPILTVQEAIKACSFLPDSYRMEAGADLQQSALPSALKCLEWSSDRFWEYCNVIGSGYMKVGAVQASTYF